MLNKIWYNIICLYLTAKGVLSQSWMAYIADKNWESTFWGAQNCMPVKQHKQAPMIEYKEIFKNDILNYMITLIWKYNFKKYI